MLAKVFSNAAANIAGGAASVICNIALAAIAARHLSGDEFARWTLVTSIGTTAGVFALGLSTNVTRLAAELDRELGSAATSFAQMPSVVFVARRLARQLCTGSAVLAVAFCCALPYLYAQLAQGIPTEFALSALVQFLGALWIVASQPDQGALVAAQKNWSITAGIVIARFASIAAFASALAWVLPPSLLALSICQALGLWAGWLWLRRNSNAIAPRSAQLSVDEQIISRRLWKLTAAMSTWAIGMIAVQFGVTPFVSFLAPSLTATTYAAITLSAALSSIFSASLGGLLSPIARLVSTEDALGLSSTVRAASAVCFMIATAIFVTTAIHVDWIFQLWLGQPVSSQAHKLICWFLLQQYVRSCSAPAAMLLAMTGSPRVVAIAPLLESATSLIVAAPLGLAWGANAFATALFVGAAGASIATWCLALLNPLLRSRSLVFSMLTVQGASIAIAFATIALTT